MKIIIVEDNLTYNNRILDNINKILIKENKKIECLSFYKYDSKLKTIIYSNEKKIYFLDINLGDNSLSSGYDIAREIRMKAHDWSSIIIIESNYDLRYNFISARLAILTYISKFCDFDNNIRNSFKVALDIFLYKNEILINNHYRVYQNDILYVLKEKYSKYCIIKTTNNEYRVRKSLTKLEEELNLKRIKKHLLANTDNIISVKESEITFKNKDKININL